MRFAFILSSLLLISTGSSTIAAETIPAIENIHCACQKLGPAGDQTVSVGAGMLMMGRQFSLSENFKAPDRNQYRCTVRVTGILRTVDSSGALLSYGMNGYVRQSSGNWSLGRRESSEYESEVTLYLTRLDNGKKANLRLQYDFDEFGRPHCSYKIDGRRYTHPLSEIAQGLFVPGGRGGRASEDRSDTDSSGPRSGSAGENWGFNER